MPFPNVSGNEFYEKLFVKTGADPNPQKSDRNSAENGQAGEQATSTGIAAWAENSALGVTANQSENAQNQVIVITYDDDNGEFPTNAEYRSQSTQTIACALNLAKRLKASKTSALHVILENPVIKEEVLIKNNIVFVSRTTSNTNALVPSGTSQIQKLTHQICPTCKPRNLPKPRPPNPFRNDFIQINYFPNKRVASKSAIIRDHHTQNDCVIKIQVNDSQESEDESESSSKNSKSLIAEARTQAVRKILKAQVENIKTPEQSSQQPINERPPNSVLREIKTTNSIITISSQHSVMKSSKSNESFVKIPVACSCKDNMASKGGDADINSSGAFVIEKKKIMESFSIGTSMSGIYGRNKSFVANLKAGKRTSFAVVRKNGQMKTQSENVMQKSYETTSFFVTSLDCDKADSIMSDGVPFSNLIYKESSKERVTKIRRLPASGDSEKQNLTPKNVEIQSSAKTIDFIPSRSHLKTPEKAASKEKYPIVLNTANNITSTNVMLRNPPKIDEDEELKKIKQILETNLVNTTSEYVITTKSQLIGYELRGQIVESESNGAITRRFIRKHSKTPKLLMKKTKSTDIRKPKGQLSAMSIHDSLSNIKSCKDYNVYRMHVVKQKTSSSTGSHRGRSSTALSGKRRSSWLSKVFCCCYF